MTIVRRQEVMTAPTVPSQSGRREEAARKTRRMGGRWTSSLIRNLGMEMIVKQSSSRRFWPISLYLSLTFGSACSKLSGHRVFQLQRLAEPGGSART